MSTISKELLTTLGVEPGRVSDLVPLGEQPASVGEGSVKQVALSLAMLAAGPGADSIAIGHPKVRQAGCEAGWEIKAPGAIRIKDIHERALTVHAINGAEAATSDSDPSLVVIKPGEGQVALLRADGTGLVFEGKDGRLNIGAIDAAPLHVEPLSIWEPPCAQWVSQTDDPWLRELVAAQVGTAWGDSVAAGAIHRLSSSRILEPANHVAQLLSGTTKPVEPATTSWARTCSPAQIATAQRLAITEVDELSIELNELEREPHYDDDIWWDRLLELFERREALEGVRDLLASVGAAKELDVAVGPMDSRGERFIAALPVNRAAEDEWLWRGRLVDPDAWWIRTAKPEE